MRKKKIYCSANIDASNNVPVLTYIYVRMIEGRTEGQITSAFNETIANHDNIDDNDNAREPRMTIMMMINAKYSPTSVP